MIEELPEGTVVDMVPYRFSRTFMAQSHNYYCAVCKENPGVANCHTGVLEPCWRCQEAGYQLVHLRGWVWKFLRTIGLVRLD